MKTMDEYKKLAEEMTPINLSKIIPAKRVHGSVDKFFAKRWADIAYQKSGTDRRKARRECQRDCFIWR